MVSHKKHFLCATLAFCFVTFCTTGGLAATVSKDYQLQDDDTAGCGDQVTSIQYETLVSDSGSYTDCGTENRITRTVNENSTANVFYATPGSVLANDTLVRGVSWNILIQEITPPDVNSTGHLDLLDCSTQRCNGGTVTTVDTISFTIPRNTYISNPDISALSGVITQGNYLGFRLRIQAGNDTRWPFRDPVYRIAYGVSSNPSADVRFVVTEELCAATTPSGLTVVGQTGPYRAELTWTADCANNDRYVIYRDGQLLGQTAGCVGAYADNTIQPDSSYSYDVYGYSDGGSCESQLAATDTLTTGSCTDPTLSSLTIQTPSAGSTINGDQAVSVLVTHAGGSNFTVLETGIDSLYQSASDSNDDRVWDTSLDTVSLVTRSTDYPVGVTLAARGYDPDCNELRTISQTNTVDNTCLRAPTITIDDSAQYAGQGQTASYAVTVFNNASSSCNITDYSFAVVSESDSSNFAASVFDQAVLTIPPQSSATTNLLVSANADGTEWSVNTTEFSVVNSTGQPGVANQPVTTSLFDANPLIHNSISTKSSKHAGKWGTSQGGAKYGNFKCATCHQSGSGNIKRVRTAVVAPNTPIDQFPIEQDPTPPSILLLDLREGTAQLGDDSRADKTQSSAICEACHSYDATRTAGVIYHAYNMASVADPGHKNKEDCIACHPHKQGFRKSCTACHNNGIDDGATANAVPSYSSPDLHGRHAISLNCATCHGAGADDGSHAGHREGIDSGNQGNVTFDPTVITDWNTTTKNCTNSCHVATDGVVIWQDTTTIADLACVDCHAVGKLGAVVTLSSTHVDPDGANLDGGTDLGSDCTACHPSGAATHHKTSNNVAVIPNNTQVGIDYPYIVHETTRGVVLGGTQTKDFGGSEATEAEICWDCHDMDGDGNLNGANDISEWGGNTDTNGTGQNYDFGTLSQATWTGASWTSAVGIFSYKTGAIESTHAADGRATRPGLDPVAAIRCSYCHNVHNGSNGDGATAGAPFLRGTWKGNPYKEDGAPQAKAITGFTGNWYDYFGNNSSDFFFGSVPRGWGGSNGGNTPTLPNSGYDNLARPSRPDAYWIDQNTNPNPTGTGTGNTSLGWTANNSAGLCALCHGDADGSWNTTGSPNEIDQINHFGNSADDWIGTNGHSNAVLGGSGYYKANIFDLRGGNIGDSDNPAMAFFGASDPGNTGWNAPPLGFRNTGGAGFLPYLNGPNDRRGQDWYDYYIWGATIDDTTIDQQYHQFSCSKCHNPHGSRLPRLMITNCLDTKHNTWDDDSNIPGSGDSEFGTLNQVRSISNWTSAQNCHRLGGVADGSGPEPEDCDGRGYNGCQSGDTRAQSGTGSGWNNVTPW